MSYEADRIDRLEAATERLSQNVTGLSTSLALVAEINQRQSELELRSARNEAKAATKVDLAEVKAEQAKKAIAFRKATLQRIYLITLMVVFAVGLVVAYLVDRDVTRRNEEEAKCQAAVVSTKAVQSFVESQLDIERNNKFIDDEVRSKRLASLKQLGAAFPIPNCGGSQ